MLNKFFKNITKRQKQYGIGVIILLFTLIGVVLYMRTPEAFDPSLQLGAITARPCIGRQCVMIPKGCTFNNPACAANQDCKNNQCTLKQGCVYSNPSCNASQNCVNNQCVLKQGCLYGNPLCNTNQDCVNNQCVIKRGCAYNNPACAVNQDCVNNQCVLKSGCLYGNPTCNPGDECVNNTCIKSISQGKKFLTLVVATKVDNQFAKYENMSWERDIKIRANDNIQIFDLVIWNITSPKKISLYKFDKTFNSDPIKYGLGGQDWVNYRESFNILNVDIPEPDSKAHLEVLKPIMKTVVENQPAEHYGIKFFGHGTGNAQLFSGFMNTTDSESLLSYINSIIGKKIDFLDWDTNCGDGVYNVAVSQYRYADYILASDLDRGAYEFDWDDGLRLKPSQILVTFFSPGKTIRQSLIDMVNSERLLWETQTTKNDMIAKQTKQSVSIYDTSKFEDLMASANLDKGIHSGDILDYVKKNYSAQEQKFYDFRFHYISNKDFVTWNENRNGFWKDSWIWDTKINCFWIWDNDINDYRMICDDRTYP